MGVATGRLSRLQQLFFPASAPRIHGLSMAVFLVLTLVYDAVVMTELVASGGRTWTALTSLSWLLSYLVASVAGGLAGLDLALLRRRGLQRQVMLSLALILLILSPAVVLMNPLLAQEQHRLVAVNGLGCLALISTLLMLLPVIRPDRLQALNGGQRRPDRQALHRRDDAAGEQLSDWLGYLVSGILGAALMLITGIALSSPPATFVAVFERHPMLPNYFSMTFINGSLCVALAAFAATLRDRRIISESSEKALMLVPVLLFLIVLVIIPLLHQQMGWIVDANLQLLAASLQRFSF